MEYESKSKYTKCWVRTDSDKSNSRAFKYFFTSTNNYFLKDHQFATVPINAIVSGRHQMAVDHHNLTYYSSPSYKIYSIIGVSLPIYYIHEW